MGRQGVASHIGAEQESSRRYQANMPSDTSWQKPEWQKPDWQDDRWEGDVDAGSGGSDAGAVTSGKVSSSLAVLCRHVQTLELVHLCRADPQAEQSPRSPSSSGHNV